jgi:hypothetical protein
MSTDTRSFIKSDLALGFFLTLVSIKYTQVGFNPTDDGLIISQAHRILHGELPHRDFLSPRPVGSPLIHSLELLLPTPQLITSRFIVIIQLVVIAVLLTRFISTTLKTLDTLPIRILLITSIYVLNLHQFPLMPWHTIDGILVVTLGISLFHRTKSHQFQFQSCAALLFGLAPIIKQSFAPTILVGFVFIIQSHDLSRRRKLTLVFLLTVPAFVYLSWIVSLGGGNAMLNQLFGGPMPQTISLWFGIHWITWMLVACSLFLLLSRCVFAVKSAIQRFFSIALGAAIGANALYFALLGDLQLSNWSIPLVLTAVASLPLLYEVSQKDFRVYFSIIFLALMVCLSWGYPNPNLMSGALLFISLLPMLISIDRFLGRSRSAPRIATSVFLNVLSLILAVFLLQVQHQARSTVAYRDLALNLQTQSLSDIGNDFVGIRSNPRMYQILSDVGDCVKKYPSQNLALLPDGSSIPMLWGKRNPFKVDWWTPSELVYVPSPYINEIFERSSNLILFQTVPMSSVAGVEPIARANINSQIFSYGDDSMQRIFDGIPGEIVYCGSLVGKFTDKTEP